MAYNSISPIGPERADLRIAYAASQLAKVWRGKGQQPYKLEGFLLKFGEHVARETPREIEARMQRAMRMYKAAQAAAQQKRSKKPAKGKR